MLPSDKPIANPVAVLREEFDDWAVLFNPDTAEAVGINPTGVLVWKSLDGERDLNQILDIVQEQFEDTPSAAGQDLTTFIDDLAQRGFVGYEVTEVNR
jgi:SynChlorMet cassette protein ScmD